MAENSQLNNLREEDITTVLAEDISSKGVLSFKSSLMIRGNFEGQILSEGLLLVGEKARVTADVQTSVFISRGFVRGNIEATRTVVLAKTSIHIGDITCPEIIIESGAKFLGACRMPAEEPSALENKP